MRASVALSMVITIPSSGCKRTIVRTIKQEAFPLDIVLKLRDLAWQFLKF